MTWQPIETAPKDGKPLDLWGHWPEHDQWERSADARWDAAYGEWRIDHFRADQYMHPPTFTHWMRVEGPPTPTIRSR